MTGGPPVGDRVQQVAGVGYTADELYEHSPCGLLTLSTSGTVLAVNATVLGWTGRQRREVVGRPVVQLLAPSSRLTWETRVAPELGLLGRVTAAELAVRGSGGPDVAVLVSCTITSVTPGAPDVVRVVAFPAGERFAYEHELVRLRRAAEKSAARMRVLHRVASDLTAARTPDDAAERLVRALAEESGASAVTVWLHAPRERVLRRAAGTRAPDELAPELVRLPSASLVATAARTRAVAAVESPEHCARTHPQTSAALGDARMQAVLAVPLLQDGLLLGAYTLAFTRARPFGDDELAAHAVIAGNAAQVLHVAQLHAELGHLALHDALTALPNRTLFFDRLEQALAHSSRDGSPVSVLMLDLDGFKLVNDGLGHGAGDEVLVEVSGRLRRAVRGSDTVARLGGDEFVVLCEGAGRDHAVGLAAKLEAAVRTPIVVGSGEEVVLTTSVGVAVHTHESAEAPVSGADLVRAADAAMYQAKARGKARHTVYDIGMRSGADERARTAVLVRDALLDDGVVVHYQPIVDLRTGRVTGVEALCRVEAPDGRLLMPAEFIGVAEDRGLVVALGQRVLTRACRQLVAWHEEGLGHLDVSVNVAAQQAAEDDLADVVAGALAEAGCPPDRLVLELTESTLLTAAPSTLSSLHALRELGVGIAIDDFGTQYASLHYVQHFPITELKVDRSFVAGLPHERVERAIVSAVAGLASDLDLVCVAEGIETPEQAGHLAALGVRGQGYLLGRPAAAQHCAELLGRTLHR